MAPLLPLELILARNLIAGLALAALLCDADGTIVFLNDAAGELLGRRFEELGQVTAERWNREFTGSASVPLLPRTASGSTPTRERQSLQSRDQAIEVEVSTVPLTTMDGLKGTIVFLSPCPDAEG